MTTATKRSENSNTDVQELDRVTIRFAGDSGDGMQLAGTQFTKTSAVWGNDVSTLPDIPAEIRAPQGSLPGVSGFARCSSGPTVFRTSTAARDCASAAPGIPPRQRPPMIRVRTNRMNAPESI